MKLILYPLFLFVGLFVGLAFTSGSLAQEKKNKSLKVVFGVFRPPYVYETKKQGLDYELAKAAFEKAGYSIETMHSPNRRAHQEIEQKKVDAVVGVAKEDKSGFCYSEPLYYYDNVAISKSKDKLKIDSISDLRNVNFLSFGEAHRYLGDEYAELVKSLKRDTDISNQQTQSKLFWTGKAQVIIADINVFRYYRKSLSPAMNTDDEVLIHRIFKAEANPRVVVFRDAKICAEFNQGLQEIKAEGSYQKAVDKYLKVESVKSN